MAHKVDSSKSKIPKNVKALGLVSLFTDVSSEMIKPILPIFLVSVLGASTPVVGLIEGISESLSSILKIFSGYISDKIKKRKFLILIGYLLSAISKPLMAFSTIWQQILVLKIGDRFGKGIRTAPRDALISESSQNKGTAFGFHRMLDTLGVIIGILIATYVLSNYTDGVKKVFLIAALPGLIAVLIILFFVTEKKYEKSTGKKLNFSFKDLDGDYKRFLFSCIIFNLSNMSTAFFILKAQEVGVAIFLIPIIYLVYNFFYAGLSYPLGKYSDKTSKKKIIAFGFFMFSVSSFLFAYFNTQSMMWVIFAIAGTSIAITDSIPKAFVSELIPSDKRATALGVFDAFIGIAIFPASFVVGILWNIYGSSYAFMYSGILSLISAILVISIVKRK